MTITNIPAPPSVATVITLRDHFAAAALSGLIAAQNFDSSGHAGLARTAYKIADAMIAVKG